MKFEIIKKSNKTNARAGIIHTEHGPIETPVFMPVGTQGAVKALTWDMLTTLDAQIVLGNTYHLALRPGIELIQKMGGLHGFTTWNKPILTDSGGYQIFSLNKIRKIEEEGVHFKSHIDGSSLYFTPEKVIDLQLGFNSDIMMPLDICSGYNASRKEVEAELRLTTKWEKKARAYWEPRQKGNHLFGIVQGGFYEDLRTQSAEDLVALDFPGYAIGGVSVGEPLALMEDMIAFTSPLLPEHKPRYVLGIGLPENLTFAIDHGIDMFDCVLPTRLARHGQVFTRTGRINLSNLQFSEDPTPLDPLCDCSVCQTFSKAYLRHLIRQKEITGVIYLSFHNTHFLIQLVKAKRQAILDEPASN